MTELTFFFMEQNRIDDKNAPCKPFEKMDDCPFCGGYRLTIRTEDDLFWGHCRSCGSTGPERRDRHNAIGVWNKRDGKDWRIP